MVRCRRPELSTKMQPDQSRDDDRLITDVDFGRRTNISRTTRWELRRDGKLHFVKVGRRIGYPMSELRRVLSEGTEGVRHG